MDKSLYLGEGTNNFVDLAYLTSIFEGSVWFCKIPFTFIRLVFGIEISISPDIQSYCQNETITFLFLKQIYTIYGAMYNFYVCRKQWPKIREGGMEYTSFDLLAGERRELS